MSDLAEIGSLVEAADNYAKDELVREIDARVNAISTALRELVALGESTDDPEVPLSLLFQLADVKRQAGDVYKKVEEAALAVMGEKEIKVEPFGTFQSRKKTKRTQWQWEPLVQVVVARALDERKLDEETGEYEREAEVVARVMRECVGFSQGKVKGLRARGIDPGEFCTEEPDGWQVQLPAAGTDE